MGTQYDRKTALLSCATFRIRVRLKKSEPRVPGKVESAASVCVCAQFTDLPAPQVKLHPTTHYF